MARRLKDWITAYMAYVKNTEPRKSYHYWVGLTILSTVLQRKVYFKTGFETWYPNLYVVLVGPTGARKGTACSIGTGLLKDIPGIKIAPEATTSAQLIRCLKESATTYYDPGTQLQQTHSSMLIYSEEFSVFLGSCNTEFLSILTNWFDSRDKWDYETKTQGKDYITGVCVTILAATAPDWLPIILPRETVGGGFTGRIIFVVEDDKEKNVTTTWYTKAQERLREDLIHDLEEIHLLASEFRMDEEAISFYDEWYPRQANNPPFMGPHFGGYQSRRQVHAIKVAMLLSASRGNDHIITAEDLKRAVASLEAIEPKMPRVFSGLGKSRYTDAITKIIDFIISRGHVTRPQILRALFPDVDDYILDIAIKFLLNSQLIYASALHVDPLKTVYTFNDKVNSSWLVKETGNDPVY